jgi:hypothetical protein
MWGNISNTSTMKPSIRPKKNVQAPSPTSEMTTIEKKALTH